jgi:hypothetical protein
MFPLLVPPPSFKIGENLNTVKYGFSPSKSVQGRRLFACMSYIVMPTPSVPFKIVDYWKFFPYFLPSFKKKRNVVIENE